MVLRYRNYHPLLKTVTLGTSLTALFLLVRCSVPERDYSQLGIGNEAGSGGASGSGGGGSGGSSAGQGGGGGSSGESGGGGQAGGSPVVPIPCEPEDAGTTSPALADAGDAGGSDAGSVDAGPIDAGATDATCACVDGFIQAVDADGDGVGTRACSLAPGLDCDDGDGAVTHNACGGCTELPSTLGEACLDCGSYACGGPDTLVCAALPGPVEDPDCRCVDGLITARDTDGDGQGTRLCEFNPGPDCNDGDAGFVTNECGGCAELPAAVGDACNECGVYACNGSALACVPQAGVSRCFNSTTREVCQGNGFWGNGTTCANVCYEGNCETCTPGTFRCIPFGASEQLERCTSLASLGSSSYGIGWGSYDSCTPTETCNAAMGVCTGYLLLPRDRSFDVAPRRPGGLPWHDILDTALDADYG